MKYTIKYILIKARVNTRNQLPIYLRITIDRKRSLIATGHTVLENQWDVKNECVKSSHKLAAEINADLHAKKSSIINKMVVLQMEGKKITAADLKVFAVAKSSTNNIFDFIKGYIEEVRNKRSVGTITNYKKNYNRLKEFNGSEDLSFEEIDSSYLSRYENHLRKAELGENYVRSLIVTIRTFFNAAKKRGITTNYPFNIFEMPAYNSPIKDYLSLDELEKWETYTDEATTPALKQAAIYFLLGAYTAFRVSDWRQFSIKDHIKGNEILLRTQKNGEWIAMEISDPLKRNIERIKNTPLEIEDQTINDNLKIIAEKLKIKKHITTHTGRHTFAITICAEGKVGCETCSELMGITPETCIKNYYRVTQRKINDETRVAWSRLK